MAARDGLRSALRFSKPCATALNTLIWTNRPNSDATNVVTD